MHMLSTMLRPVSYTLLAGVLFFGSCGSSPAQTVKDAAYDRMLQGLLSGTVPTTSVEHVKEQSQAVLLDAREQKEYSVSHVQSARWVGYDDFDLARVADLPKDTAIIVYCSVGYRSERITEKLMKAGYTNVQNLYGGIFEWVNRELPVVDAAGPTDRIHAYDKSWGRWVKRGIKVY